MKRPGIKQLKYIKKAIEKGTGVGDLSKRAHGGKLREARQLFCLIAIQRIGSSSKQIAEILGRTYETARLYVKQARARLERDEGFAYRYERYSRRLVGKSSLKAKVKYHREQMEHYERTLNSF